MCSAVAFTTICSLSRVSHHLWFFGILPLFLRDLGYSVRLMRLTLAVKRNIGYAVEMSQNEAATQIPAPHRVDRRARRHQETIEEILDIAADVMTDEGVNGLSLAEVARRLGVQPPSIYKYFASLMAIYDALFVAVKSSTSK